MRVLSIAKRLIKQLRGDKRSIALMFVAPVFVMYLLSAILSSATTTPNIDLISAPPIYVEKLQTFANVNKVSSEEIALKNLNDKSIDAYIVFIGNKPNVTLDGADPSITSLVMNTLNKLSLSSTTQKPEISFLHGSMDMGAFDSMAPILMGFFIFFFVFLIAGVAFLRERISGTLDRILATPLKRWEIVLGYFLGFGSFVAIQTIILQIFSVYGLNVPMVGSFWAVLVLNLVLASGSLALGTLLSAFARNEFQLFQFIPIVIVPQIMFSGIFDLRNSPVWAKILSKVFPMTYGAEALKDVMLRGKSLIDVRYDVLILIGYALLFLILNTIALKKYRKA
ncbi:ABC transporter permease [Clostridium estertheticum]|uniref:ABC transporter permease n=1 Tax=Clostridium estertheticum TaxID=238834 RepID=A0AA47EM42_9CLOT|nr:ABC transporter permease [Clostridium estertheticum]MBU3156661.1 ABC transporter permease [Clostridium estertheticum]WAG62759.1 ABC transporter permease [Clostridium estertheticum]